LIFQVEKTSPYIYYGPRHKLKMVRAGSGKRTAAARAFVGGSCRRCPPSGAPKRYTPSTRHRPPPPSRLDAIFEVGEWGGRVVPNKVQIYVKDTFCRARSPYLTICRLWFRESHEYCKL